MRHYLRGALVAVAAEAPGKMQMIEACMNKQKAENRTFCMADLKEQKVSSGAETGAVDRPHQ